MTNLRKQFLEQSHPRGFPSFGLNRQETLLRILAESQRYEDMIYSLSSLKREISRGSGLGQLSFYYEKINKANSEMRSDVGIYQIVRARDDMVTAIDHSLEELADLAIGSPYTEPEEVIRQLAKIRDEAETILIREYGWTMQTLESEGHLNPADKTDSEESSEVEL